MILNCNNQIAKLQAKLEEKKLQTIKHQAELDKVLKNASSKSLFLGQVKMYAQIIFKVILTSLLLGQQITCFKSSRLI